MMKTLSALTLLAAGAALGQTPAFEVASVKATAPGPWRESKFGVDRIDLPGVTLRYCLAFAYGLKEFQVSGPPWITEQRYDIVAKGPEGTRREQLPDMLKTLLAHRFQLQAHNETKEFNVFVLSVAKNGPKLHEAPADPDAEAVGAKFGLSMSGAGVGKLEARNANMAGLANTLVRLFGSPVLDQTALTGRYDFVLEYSPEEANGMRTIIQSGGPLPPSAESGVSIFASLQQLGLRLDARKAPLPAVVVDRAERVPTEN
jgi:uncharacterized protein (TIGR03435 family)